MCFLRLAATNNLMKMIPGALNPGKPVANLYVRCPLFYNYHDDLPIL